MPASNTVRSTKLPSDIRYEQDYAVAFAALKDF